MFTVFVGAKSISGLTEPTTDITVISRTLNVGSFNVFQNISFPF